MIESNWDGLVGSVPVALLDALKELPGEALIETPSVVVGADYLKHVISGADPQFYRRNVEVVVSGRTGADELRERLISLTAQSVDHRSAGRLGQAVDVAQRARRMVNDAERNEVGALRETLPHLTLQWARSFDQADRSQALREYEESFTLARLTGQPNLARRAAGSLAWMYANSGSAESARGWLNRSHRLGAEEPRYDISRHLAAGLLSHYLLEPSSRSRVMQVQHPALLHGEYWAAALWLQAMDARDAGEAILVQQAIERAAASRPRGVVMHGANRRYLTGARWRVGLLLGTPIGSLSTHEFESSSSGELALESAYRRGAFHEALKLKPHDWQIDAPRQRASALLISAACRLRLGRDKSAVHDFAQADAIIEHQGLFSLYTVLRLEDLRELGEKSGRTLDVETMARLTDHRGPAVPVLVDLTPRESQLMHLLTTNKSNHDIAAELFITANTLKSISRRLYRKLEIHSREEAADIARRLGLD